MATTTNYGWDTPDDTDLVKDGAAAIRTLGSSVDTSFVDLLGGTTGQVLSKASNTDLDFAFITPAAGGKVLQVVSTNKDDTFTLTSTTFTDITGLSVTITPSSATSKIMVIAMLNYSGDIGSGSSQVRLMRASTAIAVGATAGSRISVSAINFPVDSGQFVAAPITILDAPATTSATTYKLQIKTNDATATAFVNRAETDNDNGSFSRGFSSITVMEIGA